MKITGAQILNGGQLICRKDIVIENGIITDVCDHVPFEGGMDLAGMYLAPGFIDMHCHGGDGYEFIDATPEAFHRACRIHSTHGTRVLYPTISATDFETFAKCLKLAREIKNDCGLEIPGLHLEGPYLSPEMCGAQDTTYMHAPDPAEYIPLLDKYSDIIARWTYAPEYDDGSFLRALNENGVIAAVGHSNATYESMLPAYENNCRIATHLYSSMSTITRHGGFRKLGVIECAYLFDEMYTEAIGDCCHIPPELMRLIVKIKSPDRVCLITDGIRFAGMEDPDKLQGGTERIPYIVEDGVAKLADRSGFAGSIVTTEQILKRMAASGIELPLIVKMLTETPAKAMRLERHGCVAPGFVANFTVFDKDLNIVNV